MKQLFIAASLSWLVLCGVSAVSAAETNAATAIPAQPAPGVRSIDGPTLSVLTEEQRASFARALREQQDKIRILQSQIRNSRRALYDSLSGTFDEEAVRKQALALANQEAELTVIRLKAFSQVQPPLSSDQIAKLKNLSPSTPAAPPRLPESRPDRQRILQRTQSDPNNLPPKR